MQPADTISPPMGVNTDSKSTQRIDIHNLSKPTAKSNGVLSHMADDLAGGLIDCLPESVENTIRTTCPYCGVGCGVLATVTTDNQGNNAKVSVQGDPEHPANFGKLCSKGSALAQTLGVSRRLTYPYYQNKKLAMQSLRSLAMTTMASSTEHELLTEQDKAQQTINPTDWDTVLDDISVKLADTIAKHGRDSVMFYVSGQLLTEDYYVANKLLKGFVGTNNIDSNSRLCMSSAVAGHKRAFGADLVTGSYTDFEDCNLLVLVGSNMAWCHPILFGRFLKAKQDDPNKKLVVIDPRRTDSCEFADLHLPIAPGSDTHLYNGLLTYLEQQGYRDDAYASRCQGMDDALKSASNWSIDNVAQMTEVDTADIEQFYKLVAQNDKTVTAFSMGVNQSSSGTDKVNAIINTHLLTGRVGKQGANPFSLTGQPNAMGGREVGALSNLLAAHLDLSDSQHRELVADFWQAPQPISPNVGVAACDAADAILDGRIKAIWIMATNPVVSLPEADKFREALAECDLVIVSECSVDSDTIRCADIVLPAAGWGEKSGTVTNSERRISRQRPLLPSAGEAKPDWWILSQVATRMGFQGFGYTHAGDIFNEHAQLTQYQNQPVTDHKANINQAILSKRHFRILNLVKDLTRLYPESALLDDVCNPILTQQQYDAMPPFQWGGSQIDVMNDVMNSGSDTDGIEADQANKRIGSSSSVNLEYLNNSVSFVSINPPKEIGAITGYRKRAKFRLCTDHKDNNKSLDSESVLLDDIRQEVKQDGSSHLNLRLITGRLRDQWHTMTRTGLAATLNQQQSLPTVTLNLKDAKRLHVADKDFVQLVPHQEVHSETSTINQGVMAQVAASQDMREGDAFMPMHWSDAFASLARVGTLIPTCVDPHSKQPELKNSAISVRPIKTYSLGQILVHPDWLDSVITQLRTITEQSGNKQKSSTYSSLFPALPSITWSISQQYHSVLIQVSVIEEAIYQQMMTQQFWQKFIDKVLINNRAINERAVSKSDSIQSDSIKGDSVKGDSVKGDSVKGDSIQSSSQNDISIVVNKAKQQLRVIVRSEDVSLDASLTNTSVEPLMMAVYLAPNAQGLPSIHWLDTCFDNDNLADVPSVKWLLAGRPASGYVDPGPLVCSCMSVGANIIVEAIRTKGCTDAVSVGKYCKAGTNCGSCIGQINELITEYG